MNTVVVVVEWVATVGSQLLVVGPAVGIVDKLHFVAGFAVVGAVAVAVVD